MDSSRSWIDIGKSLSIPSIAQDRGSDCERSERESGDFALQNRSWVLSSGRAGRAHPGRVAVVRGRALVHARGGLVETVRRVAEWIVSSPSSKWKFRRTKREQLQHRCIAMRSGPCSSNRIRWSSRCSTTQGARWGIAPQRQIAASCRSQRGRNASCSPFDHESNRPRHGLVVSEIDSLETSRETGETKVVGRIWESRRRGV